MPSGGDSAILAFTALIIIINIIKSILSMQVHSMISSSHNHTLSLQASSFEGPVTHSPSTSLRQH